MKKRRLILASASPRREQILKNAGYDFEIIVSMADESIENGTSAKEAVELLSKRKALSVLRENPDAVVIGCDTVVSLDGRILSKPKSKDMALEMLCMLSAKEHTVFSGVTVAAREKTLSFVSSTTVEFYELSRQSALSYVNTNEPMDKAGAYGIQGFGSVLVKRINGDYFTVMGLPVSETARALAQFGIEGIVKL